MAVPWSIWAYHDSGPLGTMALSSARHSFGTNRGHRRLMKSSRAVKCRLPPLLMSSPRLSPPKRSPPPRRIREFRRGKDMVQGVRGGTGREVVRTICLAQCSRETLSMNVFQIQDVSRNKHNDTSIGAARLPLPPLPFPPPPRSSRP